MGRKIKELERRVTFLECAISGGHKPVFIDSFSHWAKIGKIFKFKCLVCGFEILKSEDELIDIELAYLESIGVIKVKEPIPPACEDIAESDVSPDPNVIPLEPDIVTEGCDAPKEEVDQEIYGLPHSAPRYKKPTVIKEGPVENGGRKPPPKTSKPKVKPKGQNPKR